MIPTERLLLRRWRDEDRTPFAAMNDTEHRVRVVLDAALMRHETINCHPLVNTMTTSLARADLVRFLEATGHPPLIAAVAGSGEDAIASPQATQAGAADGGPAGA